MKPSPQAQLDALSQEILEKDISPELRAGAFQLVTGKGNPEADIVFIGEAPGKNEDEQGIPFIGAAGKILNDLLTQIGFSRDDVYVTNIVKYRPPNNRDPLPTEKAAFLPYLLREIEIIKPKLVVALGRHSMEYFLPDAKISQVHGQLFKVAVGTTNVNFTPFYHPAATIYNRTLRQELIDDFLSLPDVLKTLS